MPALREHACSPGAQFSLAAAHKTLPEIAATPVRELLDEIEAAQLPAADATSILLREADRFASPLLNEVGLGYLTLDRPTRTLSGGEIERVNLTTCLGASLVNTLFVMDEPTVGLHRATPEGSWISSSAALVGNTLVVVEHEEAVIRRADHIVDIGPGRGRREDSLWPGGRIQRQRGFLRSPPNIFREESHPGACAPPQGKGNAEAARAFGTTIFRISTSIFHSAFSAA